MDFSNEIAKFQSTGVYNYQIDDGGNLLISSQSSEFNQHYISIPLSTDEYSASKINSFYPTNFTEFIPTQISVVSTSSISDLTNELSHSLSLNNTLQTQLEQITNIQQSNSSAADTLAAKQTIIGLRMSLGQGHSNTDFSSIFPYIPLK